MGLLLLRGRLSSSHLHVSHTLCYATNTTRRSTIARLRGVISTHLLESRGNRLLELGRRVASRLLLLLLFLTWVCCTSVARSQGLRAELAWWWRLTAWDSVAAGPDIECAGGVCSFLFLSTSI